MKEEELSFEFDDKKFKDLLKALTGKLPQIRIGVLGSSGRTEGGLTNAEVGAFHEFGTVNLPVRSFLRMPLTDHLDEYLEKSGAFDPNTIKEVIKQKSIAPYMEKIAITAERVVADAFATSGFGAWPSSNMEYKKVHATLIESGQLRDAITSEVK